MSSQIFMARSVMTGLLTLAAFASLVSSQTTDPTPPPEFPPEIGPPKDYNNCRISANTAFSWIVAVYSQESKTIVGVGSMLTYKAFISTCRQYDKKHTTYTARGQFIWNLTRPLDPCGQERQVEGVIKHPKCIESPKTATFFDYAVFKLVEPFAISGPIYPTLGFASTAEEMLIGVHFINIVPNTIGCILPSFLDQNARVPVFDWDTFVEAIPFHSQCVKLLCEKNPTDNSFSSMCEKRIGERANGTQLCLTYKNTTRSVVVGTGDAYWIAGTPLVCNSTTYGVAAQPKLKKDNPHLPSDIHYVVTFLRVWEWLIQQMKENSAPWVHPVHVDDMNLKAEYFPEPNRPPIEGPLYPHPQSDAVVITSSLASTIATLLVNCFNKHLINPYFDQISSGYTWYTSNANIGKLHF